MMGTIPLKLILNFSNAVYNSSREYLFIIHVLVNYWVCIIIIIFLLRETKFLYINWCVSKTIQWITHYILMLSVYWESWKRDKRGRKKKRYVGAILSQKPYVFFISHDSNQYITHSSPLYSHSPPHILKAKVDPYYGHIFFFIYKKYTFCS